MVRKKVEMPKIERAIRTAAFNVRGYVQRGIIELRFRNKIRNIKVASANEDDFEYEISIVAIFKNEAEYIQEWIEYHRLIGIEHFYLVNNNSTDNYKDVLTPYVDNGIVALIDMPEQNVQIPAYEYVITHFGRQNKWLAIIDIDEFIVLSGDRRDLPAFLKRFDSSVSQLLIGWMVFGSSGQEKKLPGLVSDRFRMHASDDFIADYKAIIKPKKFLSMTIPHWANVVGDTVDETGKKYIRYPKNNTKIAVPAPKNEIRINHYYSKSVEEFVAKSNRGFADHIGLERSMQNFYEHDQNIESDGRMDSLITELKDKFQNSDLIARRRDEI